MSSINVDDQNFEEVVLKSSIPVLVDFWAEWCGPCKPMGPILEEISNEYNTKIKVVKINIDKAGDIARRYMVSSIPTFTVFINGYVAMSVIGAKSKVALLHDLRDFIK
jgi:thioredoxin 1